MRHRRPGECQRCNDIGVYGRAATHVATPHNATWPTFRTCHPCAIELLRWPDGVERVERPYTVESLQPVN